MRFHLRRVVILAICLGSSPAAFASCGSSSCPIDTATHEQPRAGLLRLDASFQYIDQNQPRIGQRRASVGEIPNPEHDEIATINRIWTFRADYDATARWGFGLALPVINRAHDHISVDSGEIEHWGFTGVGDLVTQGRYVVLPRQSAQSPSVTMLAGVKFPTGRLGAHNSDELAEITIQPGTGSYDLILGAVYSQSPAKVRTLTGDYAYLPIFVGATYKQNNPGFKDYRFGDEFQGNAGGSYPLLRGLELLGQANLRIKMRDYNGRTAEDTSFTGGNFLYLSPGLRWHITDQLAAYGYVQLPVYQRVNQEQIVSDKNLLFGLACRFGTPEP